MWRLLTLFAMFSLAACAARQPDPVPEKMHTKPPAFAMAPSSGLQKGVIFMQRSIETIKAEQQADSGMPLAVGKAKVSFIDPDGSTEQKVVSVPAADQQVPLASYRVTVHDENMPLRLIVQNMMIDAAPYVGPWSVEWKISTEYRDILDEKFSLNAETTFGKFVDYLSGYILNYRGIKLTFQTFDKERIIVISDR